MKKSFNYALLIFSIITANTFFSCSTKKVGYFNNSYPSYSVKEKDSNTLPTASCDATVQNDIEASENIISQEKEPLSPVTSSILDKAINPFPESGAKPNLSRQEKRDVKKFIKETLKGADKNQTEVNTLLLVIIAILLPPVAVALVDGISGPFWLSILLTLLFYVPGLIYALYRIFRQK